MSDSMYARIELVSWSGDLVLEMFSGAVRSLEAQARDRGRSFDWAAMTVGPHDDGGLVLIVPWAD